MRQVYNTHEMFCLQVKGLSLQLHPSLRFMHRLVLSEPQNRLGFWSSAFDGCPAWANTLALARGCEYDILGHALACQFQ